MSPFDCVVDASVGIKLFLIEEHSAAADQLFEGLAANPPARFYVPDLFFVECANILWKYVRYHGYAAESARQDIAALQTLRLRGVPTQNLLAPALELAISHDLTAYDACYAALARELNLPFISADSRLLQKLGKSGVDGRFIEELSR